MKTIVFLYAGEKNSRLAEKSFDSQSALDRSLMWALAVDNVQQIYVLTVPEKESAVREAALVFEQKQRGTTVVHVETVVKVSWTNAMVLAELASDTSRGSADFAVYAWADCPFLDTNLTREVVSAHIKYLAEYTFADGYPYGFAPEVIGTGALAVLSSLAQGVQKKVGDLPAGKDGIFLVMKGDVNSFEIETVIAPHDFRQLRLDFSCTTKASFISCKRLYDEALGKPVPFNALELSLLAQSSASVQQTVPAFYNVQIESACSGTCMYCPYPVAFKEKYGVSPRGLPQSPSAKYVRDMSVASFRGLVGQMVSLSETAVVSFGVWGEPLLHPQFIEMAECILKNPSLSLLVETDGTTVTGFIAQQIAALVKEYPIRTSGQPPVMWIVSLDAASEQKYAMVRGATGTDNLGKSAFKKAVEAVTILEAYFPGAVYPQLVRMNENEDELEKFYRYWHDAESPSAGKLIIQKYDSFCEKLIDRKPADLSPLERVPCWHAKRDMVILADGSVPLCREYLLDGSAGNVFNEGIEAVWAKCKELVTQHIDKKYSDKCKACDEYYTFNF